MADGYFYMKTNHSLMKILLSFLVLFTVASMAFCQEFSLQKLQKFDKKKFYALRLKDDFPNIDSSISAIDSASSASSNTKHISVFTPTAKMSPMPNVDIDKDLNYTIQIKKYSNTYPYTLADNTQGNDSEPTKVKQIPSNKIEKEK